MKGEEGEENGVKCENEEDGGDVGSYMYLIRS